MEDAEIIKTLGAFGVPVEDLKQLSVLAEEMQCSIQELLKDSIHEYLGRAEECFDCPLMYNLTRP
jgi:hypothetical protein